MLKFNWRSLNNKIIVKETRKRFYNRFCFSLKYFCPGGRCLSVANLKSDIESILDYRKSLSVYNYAGSWRAKKSQIESVNVDHLAEMLTIKLENQKDIKFRVEEPYISIYAESEDILYGIANNLIDQKNNLLELTAPKDRECFDLLKSGTVLLTKSNGYEYKIILKDGRYANDSKIGIRNYLINLGDLVKLSPSVLRNLSTPYDSAWNLWFYSNDKNIVTMLELIEPGCVTNIHSVSEHQ